MLKIIATCVAAALVVSPLSLMPAALTHVETGTPTGASNTAVKGDRLDTGTRGAACWQLSRPYYDSACLYDGMPPAGEVRIVSTDRLSIAK
jgi:hypothetical protein